MPNTHESPVAINTPDYYWGHPSYDKAAEAQRQAVLNAPDSGLTPAGDGKTYYISYRGNDAADGLTAATAWATASNLQKGLAVEEGSVILFERGGVYRNVALELKEGVSVGAYGNGPKPQLLGGDKDYADEALWAQAGDNLWYTDVSDAVVNCPGTELIPNDIGNVIFDHGKIVISEHKKHTPDELTANYHFYSDPDTNRLYLYFERGNPAAWYDSIELAPNYETIKIRTHNHIIENLCIRYSASGIGTAGSDNITVRGCEIGWIGGGRQRTTRAGNAITFFNTTDNCLVENNWIYQCFDAGYSHQSQLGAQTNITVRNNLIEYCVYNVEIWTPKDNREQPMKDCLLEHNIMRYAGYGFGSRRRIAYGTSTCWSAHVSLNSNKSICDNVQIRHNVFDTAYRYLVTVYHPNDPDGYGPTLSDNVWIQKPFHRPIDEVDILGADASVGRGEGGTHAKGDIPIYGCETQAEMEASVQHFDTNPTAIILR